MSGSQVRGYQYAIVPEWLLDAEISDRALRLWAILNRYAGSDGKAFPSQQTLADRLGCSIASAKRALAELVEWQAVTIEPRYRGDGGRAASNYWLWPMMPPVAEQQQLTAEPTPGQPSSEGSLTGEPPLSLTAERQKESQYERESENDGASSGDDAAMSSAEIGRSVATQLWERRKAADKPRPAQPFVAVAKIATALYDAGHDPTAIVAAMDAVPTISSRWVEAELARQRPTRGPRQQVGRARRETGRVDEL